MVRRANIFFCIFNNSLRKKKTLPTAWCVSSILTGLLSFMLENTQALGTIETSTATKLDYARKSLTFNVKREVFRTLFPDITDEINVKLSELEKANGIGDGTGTSGGVASIVEKAAAEYDETNNGINNLLLGIFACLMGLIAYHIIGIMGAE